MEKTGFLDLYSDGNVTFYVFVCFHLVAYNVALKCRFGVSSHAINTQDEIFKRDFTKPSFKHAKIIFLSVAFLYSLSIYWWGLQYERPKLKVQRSTLTFGTYL